MSIHWVRLSFKSPFSGHFKSGIPGTLCLKRLAYVLNELWKGCHLMSWVFHLYRFFRCCFCTGIDALGIECSSRSTLHINGFGISWTIPWRLFCESHGYCSQICWGCHGDIQYSRYALPLNKVHTDGLLHLMFPHLLCFAHFAGTISGVIGVAVTGFILKHNGGSENPAGWQQSFSTCAGLGIIGSLLFILFAKGEKLFD